MEPRNWLQLIQLVFWLLIGQAQKPTETKNVCKVYSLPGTTIQDLKKAAEKIIDEQSPKDYSKQLDKVQHSLQHLNETLYISDPETGLPTRLGDEILKYQQRFGTMLSSVLNSNLDITTALNEIRSNGSETSNKLQETLTTQLHNSRLLGNMTNLLSETSLTLDTIVIALSNKMAEDEEKKQGEHIQNFHLQNETHAMVKHLLEMAGKESILQKTLTILENNLKAAEKRIKKLKHRLNSPKGIIRPTDCNDLFISGMRKSGVYNIYPYSCQCSPPVRVWCDMKTEGGGWTVILFRQKLDEIINFTRSWEDYKMGFGDPSGEYWTGNEHLHALTSSRRYALRIEVQNRSGKKRWGQWTEFNVGSESDNYELSVSGFSQLSTIGKDVLRKHNNEQFSTYDKDNDSSYAVNCASKYKGGWWYGRCFDIHPTGILGASDKRTAVSTAYFYYGRKSLIPLKKVFMKIKPAICASQKEFQSRTQRGCQNEVFQ